MDIHVLYFIPVGFKGGISQFTWAIQEKMADRMTDSICISQTIKGNYMCYFVQFEHSEALDYLCEKVEEHILHTENGTLYIPFDSVMINNTNIVTLSGVTAGITDSSVKELLSPYGNPMQIYRGFHWLGSKVSNGKCYVVFDGQLQRNIPNRIILGQNSLLVKYNGQPLTCFGCGSISHTIRNCSRDTKTRNAELEMPNHQVKDGTNPAERLSVAVGTEDVICKDVAMDTLDCATEEASIMTDTLFKVNAACQYEQPMGFTNNVAVACQYEPPSGFANNVDVACQHEPSTGLTNNVVVASVACQHEPPTGFTNNVAVQSRPLVMSKICMTDKVTVRSKNTETTNVFTKNKKTETVDNPVCHQHSQTVSSTENQSCQTLDMLQAEVLNLRSKTIIKLCK